MAPALYFIEGWCFCLDWVRILRKDSDQQISGDFPAILKMALIMA